MLAIAAGAPTRAAADRATEVMRRVNARPRGDATLMRQSITVEDVKRGRFQKAVLLHRKRFPAGYRTLYRILSPDHEAGIELLISEGDRAPAMWMYFPSAGRVVPVAARGFAALATDFACEDLLAEMPLGDYEFRLLKGDPGRAAVVTIEMIPRSERLQRELGFSRAVGVVRTDIWMIVRADYYSDGGLLFRTYTADDVGRIDGVWTARRLSMENHRAGHKTTVHVTEADYAAHLPDELFIAKSAVAGAARPLR